MELMVPLNRIRDRLRPAILIAVLMAGVAVPAFAASPFFGPQTPDRDDGRILVAQNNQNAAELLVRIQDLEQAVRDLTGRVEGLEFQLKQLLKVNEDYEYRLQELEGTAPVGKPQAAVPTDGVTPPDALPQEQPPAVTADTPMDQLPATPDQLPADLAEVPDLPATDVPMDSVGESADPLLKGGIDQLGTLGEGDDFANVPLNLNLPENALSDGDADAQYRAAYDGLTQGDYVFAEEQFRQFVDLFPQDDKAADAVNYLGEAMLQQGKYADAALVLGKGYETYKQSKRAPDIMLKAGIAMVSIPETVMEGQADSGSTTREVGCRIFADLPVRYPNLIPAFRQRLAAEADKAKCPVTN